MNCCTTHPSASGNAQQSLHTLLALHPASSHKLRSVHLRRSQNLRDDSARISLQAANFGQLTGPQLLSHAFHGGQDLRKQSLVYNGAGGCQALCRWDL